MEPTELLGIIEEAVVAIGKSIDPDDDWHPILWTVNRQDHVVINSLVGMSTEQQARAIPLIEKMQGARLAGFVVTAWFVAQDADKPCLLPPSQDPDRQEIVCISVAGPDGVITSQAHIRRSLTEAPHLKPWKRFTQPGTNRGRFPDALLAGLRA